MELPAPASGTIAEILSQDGDTVNVGQVIARMTAGAGDAQRRRAPEPPAPARSAPRRNRTVAHFADGAHISPVARRIAAEQGVDLAALHGTARGGRITKADVLAAKANGGNGASATAPRAAPAPRPPSPPARN